MTTDQEATVIAFPSRLVASDRGGLQVGHELMELETGLRAAIERLHDLSSELDRSLQFGDLDHLDDPIALSADLGDLLDGATRTLAVAGEQLQTAIELWNRESNQQ